MMSYRFSYPLYLEVTEHNKQLSNRIHAYQREGTTSPTAALINLNAFYESMITSGRNTSFLNARPHMSSLAISNNMYCNPTKKLPVDNLSSKPSFSIEAILGLNHRQNSNYLTVNSINSINSVNSDNEYDFSKSKYKPNYELSNDLSPKTTHYANANSTGSVSPDSTAKEQNLIRYNQRAKTKIVPSNGSSHINNNNKRSIDSIVDSEMRQNKSKIELNQRLVHNNIPQGKSKRVRTIFTPEQLEKLEAEFERQQYMVGPERLYLASALNLSEAQVKVWFQNRRIKWRKQHLEMQHTRFRKRCQNSETSGEITTDDDLEQESSSVTDFKSFQTVENDADFLCPTPNSVDILH